MTLPIDGTPRRAILGVAIVTGAACAGCSTSSSSSKASPPAQPNSPTSSGSATADPGSGTTPTDTPGSSASTPSAGRVVLGTTDHVPVGGGVILADRQIVLTQPTAGVIKAFTAVCTHQGCTVSSIEGDLIVCPCHGSRYHLSDGSVANGPAPRPLAPIAVTVSGTDIVQS